MEEGNSKKEKRSFVKDMPKNERPREKLLTKGTNAMYDYELLATNEFMNTSLPLNQSIDYGCNNLSKKSGDYFLVHGGDSTSITGVYEVFKNSNAKFLKKRVFIKL